MTHEEILERGLPIYLQKDIKAWVAGKQDPNCTIMDCLWGELYGSINSAYHGNEITREQYDYLFDKYLSL